MSKNNKSSIVESLVYLADMMTELALDYGNGFAPLANALYEYAVMAEETNAHFTRGRNAHVVVDDVLRNPPASFKLPNLERHFSAFNNNSKINNFLNNFSTFMKASEDNPLTEEQTSSNDFKIFQHYVESRGDAVKARLTRNIDVFRQFNTAMMSIYSKEIAAEITAAQRGGPSMVQSGHRTPAPVPRGRRDELTSAEDSETILPTGLLDSAYMETDVGGITPETGKQIEC